MSITNDIPQIITFDLEQKDVNLLKEKGFNIKNYTITENYKFNTSNYSIQIDSKFKRIADLHEYEIAVFDLNYKDIFTHIDRGNIIENSGEYYSLLFEYPANECDLKPFNLRTLNCDNFKKDVIKIFFCGHDYQVNYILYHNKNGRTNEEDLKCSIYDSTKLYTNNKKGNRIKIINQSDLFSEVLNRYKDSFRYNVILEHKHEYVNNGYVDAYEYYDLLTNEQDEVISTIVYDGDSYELYLPDTNKKAEILLDLFNSVFPRLKPHSFPLATSFIWKNDKRYWLPGRTKIEREKTEEINRHNQKMKELDYSLEKNNQEYEYLVDMLTKSGDDLVEAVALLLKNFGFNNVKTEKEFLKPGETKQEDIRIDENNRQIIIECKGIGGTSTDNDCRQIGKIKIRRERERNSKDVYALYIVNHQMFMDPVQRNNPPFQDLQITDAKEEERSLITTYNLFKQNQAITLGYASKEQTRESLLEYGLVKFQLDKLTYVGKAQEIYKDNQIVILTLANTLVKKSDPIVLEKDGDYTETEIKSLQVKDENVDEVENGEVGIMLNLKIKKGTNIYIKKTTN